MTERGAVKAPVVGFVLAAGLLSALLVAYTLTHDRPPIPKDADHVDSLAEPQCLRCHGPGMKNARNRNHPLNDRCFTCHERA
jgi:mono/diheme cytochrome c family protein